LREADASHARTVPFHINAFVVLPVISTQSGPCPKPKPTFRSLAIDQDTISKSIPKIELLSKVRRARGERGILANVASGNTLIRDDDDYRRHVEYCYINPSSKAW